MLRQLETNTREIAAVQEELTLDDESEEYSYEKFVTNLGKKRIDNPPEQQQQENSHSTNHSVPSSTKEQLENVSSKPSATSFNKSLSLSTLLCCHVKNNLIFYLYVSLL